MASAKDLRKRITSVKNTQQITRAMKMVAAAKLRRSQEAIVSLRPYARELASTIATLSRSEGSDFTHPLLAPKTDSEIKSVLVVIVSSDRGLCGGFNANVFKAAQRYARTNAHKYDKFDFAFIGKKGFEFFKNKKTGKYYLDFFKGLSFAKAKGMADELLDLYLNGEYDEIKFIYSEFKSAISQKVNVEAFLPIRPFDDNAEADRVDNLMTIYEPNSSKILDALLPRHFATQIFRMLLDSLASEHAARMTAMENATKNAGTMIKKITLVYNKTRQAGITKELLEIVSGTEAQKG